MVRKNFHDYIASMLNKNSAIYNYCQQRKELKIAHNLCTDSMNIKDIEKAIIETIQKEFMGR